MKKINGLSMVLFVQLLFSCENEVNNKVQEETKKGYQSEVLLIRKVSDNFYEHTLFMPADALDKKTFNKMMLLSNKQGVLLDSITSDPTSIEMMEHLSYYRYFSKGLDSYGYGFDYKN